MEYVHEKASPEHPWDTECELRGREKQSNLRRVGECSYEVVLVD